MTQQPLPQHFLAPSLATPDVIRAARPTQDEHTHLACILPAFNEAQNLPTLIPTLAHSLADLCDQLTLLVVDDGSTDDTAAVALLLAQDYPVELLQLSRNFGKENAITAGLDHVDADAVIIMDADCQHPAAVLREFVMQWQQGADMVVGLRCDRSDQSGWRSLASRFFYRLLSLSTNVSIRSDAGDFRLLDKRVVSAIRQLPESNRFMKGIYSWVGFNTCEVSFTPAKRHAGHTHFNGKRLLALALDGLTSFSNLPLRLASAIGALVSLSAIGYGLFILLQTLFEGVSLPGWATLTVGITLLGGIQLLAIGILGEYTGRIFAEVKQRPLYIVRQYHQQQERR